MATDPGVDSRVPPVQETPAAAPLTPRMRVFVVPLVLLLVVMTLLRLVFWIVFHSPDEPIAASVIRAFYIGFKLDLRLGFLLLLPALALAALPPLNPCRRPWARRFWIHHFTIMAGLLVLFYAVDLGNYAYLGERIDVSAQRYLENPVISLRMVWQSYPVVWGLAGLVVFAVVFRLILSRLVPEVVTSVSPLTRRRRWLARVVVALVVVGYLAGLYGKLSWYPLRWSDAFFSSNRFVADVTLNPVLFFVNTLCTAEPEVEYDRAAVASHYATTTDYLGVSAADPDGLSFARRVRPTPLAPGRANVVLILAESFAAHKTGIFGNQLDPSPSFDRIARDSLLFTRFYTPRQGTARAVFATLTGVPDTITHRTASRNPRTVTHQVVLSAFGEYEKLYFLGGSANWANIRALFANNVDDIRIVDEGSFDADRVDVWGITDLHLFEAANQMLREVRDRPFFAFIHLSGNHRPYTVPDDVPGFEKVSDVDEKVLRRNGFGSVAELNSFRFLDHAIGHYLHIAGEEAYFENSLFFILSDNGGSARSRNMTAAEKEHGLGTFHAPLVIYGPGCIPEGRVIDQPATQMDLMPTIAGALGIEALNTTMGRNLLDPQWADRGYGFFYRTRGSEGEIGLVGKEYLLQLRADGSDSHLYSLRDEDDPTVDLGDALPDRRRQMHELGLGLYHASRFLLYNNHPARYLDETVDANSAEGG
jgi:phosphoglycerol transferase MdoB-like AlkP superfamily enzyme